MFHALALAAVVGATPPAGMSTPLIQAHRGLACGVSIDPLFVRYVPPPTRHDSRNPLLWLVSGTPADGRTPATPAPAQSADCIRPLQVRNAR
jgi:hypothetical protein